jgi:hypothetical protein
LVIEVKKEETIKKCKRTNNPIFNCA